MSLELESVELDGKPVELSEPLRRLLPAERADSSEVVATLRRLNWISAERTGPRELLPLRDESGHVQVGARGELAAGLLYWRQDDSVPLELCRAGPPPTLLHQVKARMQEFFPGCDLRVSPIDGASAVSLRLRSDSRSEFQRPQNVGFGLTQLFPVLVAVLAARKGDIVLVENPEVHLHPQAQQAVGTLLACVAATGVQVIVETHSDHVLKRLPEGVGALGDESKATLTHRAYGALRDFPPPEGFAAERWSLHTKLTGGAPRRLYYRPVRLAEGPLVLIGYFGAHLPTVRFG